MSRKKRIKRKNQQQKQNDETHSVGVCVWCRANGDETATTVKEIVSFFLS